MAQHRKTLSEFWGFLKSTPRAANAFAVGTLLLWLAKATVFERLFGSSPVAYEVGKVIEGVLAAIVAGWVFYLFFALLPEYRERRVIAPYVLRKLSAIVVDCKVVLDEIGKVAGTQLHFATCTLDQLDDALDGIALDSRTKVMVDVRAALTWLDFFRSRRERSLGTIEETMRLSGHVDSRIVAMILGIAENPFFGLARSLESLPHKNMDLSVLAKPLFAYVELCRDLAGWHDSHTDIVAKPVMVDGHKVSASFSDL